MTGGQTCRGAYREGNDPSALYVDYVLTDMRKFPAVLEPLKKFVDYACTHVSEDAEAYAQASTTCYQYYNSTPFYDILDYCMNLLVYVYQLDDEPTGYLKQFYDAVADAQLVHAYTSDINKDYDLTYSVNLGAKGAIIYPDALMAYEDAILTVDKYVYSTGSIIYVDPATGNRYSGGKTPWLDWENSYMRLEFEKRTGWSRWLQLNPAAPKDNPPYNDEGDHLM